MLGGKVKKKALSLYLSYHASSDEVNWGKGGGKYMR